MLIFKTILISYVLSASLAAPTVSNATTLPIIDLGYGLWQATLNDKGQFYNFSNIRFAQPPVGNLRFAAPQPPLTNRSVVNDGQDGRICPQGTPSWSTERIQFVRSYLTNPGNSSAIAGFVNYTNPNANSFPPSQSDGRANEDCLFLDVMVPTKVYKNASVGTGVPVYVWIYGGGFYAGDKGEDDPTGMLAQSTTNPSTENGIIWVAMNYRLGALGWLAGPNFTSSGGVPNAAFLDQRLALNWVQQNIHLFGGDPQRVTIMGSSAGASSSLHQITAYGGSQGNAPFQQVVLESPAFNPNVYPIVQDQLFEQVLSLGNATSLAQLRNMSSAQAILLNNLAVWHGQYGSGGFGPVVDGTFVPELPTVLLSHGKFSKNIKRVFGGHNSDEGLLFTDPSVQDPSAFSEWVANGVPYASNQSLAYVENTLYPPVYNNTIALGYGDIISRVSTVVSDLAVCCNLRAALQAFGVNNGYGYLFSMGLGLHGEQYSYQEYDNSTIGDVDGDGNVNGTVALAMQRWILNFGATGNPNGQYAPFISPYGQNFSMGALSANGVGIGIADPAGNARCAFWQSGAYA